MYRTKQSKPGNHKFYQCMLIMKPYILSVQTNISSIPLAGNQSCMPFAETAWFRGWCGRSVKWRKYNNKIISITLSHTCIKEMHLKKTYHSHFGKIDQVVLCVVGRPLLNKGQVREVHSQIWHTGRVTTSRNIRKNAVLAMPVFNSHIILS